MPKLTDADRLILRKWERERLEARTFIKGEDALRVHLKDEIEKRERVIVELRTRLENLPIEIEAAKRRIATANLQIEGVKFKHNRENRITSLRRRRRTVRDEIRDIESQLRTMDAGEERSEA